MSSTALLQQLEHAILFGDHREVVALLDADAALVNARFPDNLNLTPLMWACRNRRESIVETLIDRGADVALTNRLEPNGDGGNTALWFTGQGASAGTTGIARQLIAAGADVNQRCEHGQTALYIAALWVHLDFIQVLVDHHADASIPDDKGKSPLESLHAGLDWCGRQSLLNAEQQLFRERAPRILPFLESIKR